MRRKFDEHYNWLTFLRVKAILQVLVCWLASPAWAYFALRKLMLRKDIGWRKNALCDKFAAVAMMIAGQTSRPQISQNPKQLEEGLRCSIVLGSTPKVR